MNVGEGRKRIIKTQPLNPSPGEYFSKLRFSTSYWTFISECSMINLKIKSLYPFYQKKCSSFLSLFGTSQVALVVKNPPANAGDTRESVSIPGSGISQWRRKWQSTPVFLPGKCHEKRSIYFLLKEIFLFLVLL